MTRSQSALSAGLVHPSLRRVCVSVPQLFEELQELLSQKAEDQGPSQTAGLRQRAGSRAQDLTPVETPTGKPQPSVFSQAPLIRWVLTLSFLVATVAMGLYAM